MDDVTAAKHLVRLLDLTSLNNDDTESRIEKLCAKAQTCLLYTSPSPRDRG